MESFLSNDVREMYSIVPEISKQENRVETIYITSNCTFNWNLINRDFHQIFSDIDNGESHSWFRNAVSQVSSIILQSETIIRNTDKNVILGNSSWTNRNSDIDKCLDKYLRIQENCVENVEIILMLTSIIERSLGDVLLLRTKNVPFLLRDLLMTEELKSIFGETAIGFSRLILGTPEGLNLRNIVWHSFPSIYEMHSSYSSLLFLMVSSFGDILKEQDLSKIIYRPLLYRSVQRQFSEISRQVEDISSQFKLYDLLLLIQTTKCVSKPFICYWKHIILYYQNERWQDCCLLIISQFENIFRYIFCQINDQVDRLLTAEIKVLYTTLDVIFDDDVVTDENSKPNKIFEMYNHNYLALLHDVFAYISGPRLRDKLSHGEVDTRALDQNVADVLLIIIFYGITAFENIDCPDWLKSIENYKCLYHKNAIFSQNLRDLLLETRSLDKIQIPEEFNMIKDFYTSKYLKDNSINTIDDIINYNDNLKVLIFGRPKSEKEIVTILTQIVDNLHKAVINLKESLDVKYIAFVERKLRSKRRATYRQLLQFLPDFYGTILTFSLFLLNVFINIQNEIGLNDLNLLKFLKSMLQCSENLAKYLHSDHNNWNESLIIIDKVFEDMKLSTVHPRRQPPEHYIIETGNGI